MVEAGEACWSPSPSGLLCSLHGLATARDAWPGVMAVLPTCAASPSVAAHVGRVVWVLLPVFGGTHVFTAVSVDCYLETKN